SASPSAGRGRAALAVRIASSLFQGTVEETPGDSAIGIDAAIAQKRPVLPRYLDELQIEIGGKHFFLVVRSLRDHAAKGIGNKAAAPEFETGRRRVIAGSWDADPIVDDVPMLVPNAVHRTHKDAVGDGMCALHGLPG